MKWAPQPSVTGKGEESSIRSSSPTSSGTSTPTTGGTYISPLAKAITERLSFWKLQRGDEIRSSQLEQEDRLLDSIDDHESHDLDPGDVIENIVSTNAPEPTSTEARDLAMEEKIVRECIRQFSKGDMYFSYSFGS